VSIFFPAYNDWGTIASLVVLAAAVVRDLTDDWEIIVVNDASPDHTPLILGELLRYVPHLRIVEHERNRGYGGALRSGFAAATKEYIFYTDGDAQYDVRELRSLWENRADADLVNGYKIARADPLHRIIIGRIYHHIVRLAFRLHVVDVDCDFRLIKRHVFDKVVLTQNSGTIALVAGQSYDIKVEYFDNTGVASMKLSWSSPSTLKQIVPASRLYPTTSTISAVEALSSPSLFSDKTIENASDTLLD